MKKLFISMMIACTAMAGNAQTVNVNTIQGTDMAQYDGLVRNVKAARVLVKGWNTISLPFAMSEEDINNCFGADCRLEKLSGISQDDNTITLNFVDVKKQGIQANTPYILHYNGNTGGVNIAVQDAVLNDASSEIAFTTNTGVRVSMNGAALARKADGIYGILAMDNKEAKFVNATNLDSRVLATRCYIAVSGISNANLVTIHGAAETTAISSVKATEQTNDKVYNMSGVQVSKNAKGIKIINGKKQF